MIIRKYNLKKTIVLLLFQKPCFNIINYEQYVLLNNIKDRYCFILINFA